MLILVSHYNGGVILLHALFTSISMYLSYKAVSIKLTSTLPSALLEMLKLLIISPLVYVGR